MPAFLAIAPVAIVLTRLHDSFHANRQEVTQEVTQGTMHKLLQFKDETLLRRALTHRSYVNENPESDGNNERLEFLGDALLTFISGEYLYQREGELGEDEMTRQRSSLVDETQLAKFATEVGLDFRMRLGQGAIQQGGYHNPRLLSSTFEAVVGAYYLDNSRNIEMLRRLLEDLFNAVPKGAAKANAQVRSHVDPKNQLQEFAQANGAKAPPKYVTEQIGGTDHAPEFRSRVYVDGVLYGEGRGSSKKKAEKQAAEDAIAKLKKRGLL